MKVGEYLNYLKVCNGYEGIKEEDGYKYKDLLRRDVNIKEYLDICDEIELNYDIKWNILLNLVRGIRDKEELNKNIGSLAKTIRIYDKHLYSFDCYTRLAESVRNLLYSGEQAEVIKHLRLVKDINDMFVYVGNKRHTYHIERDTGKMTLINKLIGNKEGIDAIIIKNEQMKFIRVDNEKNRDKLQKALKTYEYDLAIV